MEKRRSETDRQRRRDSCGIQRQSKLQNRHRGREGVTDIESNKQIRMENRKSETNTQKRRKGEADTESERKTE